MDDLKLQALEITAKLMPLDADADALMEADLDTLKDEAQQAFMDLLPDHGSYAVSIRLRRSVM